MPINTAVSARSVVIQKDLLAACVPPLLGVASSDA